MSAPRIPGLTRAQTDLCATCAYRPGTRANQDEHNKLKIRLCLLSGDPFDCHERPVGSLCEGFRRAWDAQREAGRLAAEWKRKIGRLSLEALAMVEQGASEDDAIAWHLEQLRQLEERQP